MGRVLSAIRAKPPGDGVDIDTIANENALLSHCSGESENVVFVDSLG